MGGRFARADSAIGAMAGAIQRMGLLPEPMAWGTAVTLLGGTAIGPIWQLSLPARFRADVMDSVWARREQLAGYGRLARALPALARQASTAAPADSALAARVRTAPWYTP
jgi:hypothetical protein